MKVQYLLFRWHLLQFVLIAFGFFCAGFLFTLSAADDNLALNSSFETGSTIPDGWITAGGIGCSQSANNPPLNFDWDNTQAHSGSRSVAIKNLSWPTGFTFTPGNWVSSDFIPATSFPQEYEVTVWVLGASSNINLRPILSVCQYGEGGNILTSDAFSTLNLPGTSWTRMSIRLRISGGTTQLKLGLGGKCSSAQACSGSLWFDDVILRMIGKITVHKFEDVNSNGQQDLGEQNLPGWEMGLFLGKGCSGDAISSARTDASGSRTFDGGFPFLALGEYSVAETLQSGWVNTTPVCQNVTLVAGQTPQVNFGNVKRAGLDVPYFGQKDLPWGPQGYDHAKAHGLWCGTTMAQCGCAVTSAAMVLKYYGVERGPDGEPTTPETLNNWLKGRPDGYINGDMNFQAIGKYAIESNRIFGTPKIDYLGRINHRDFTILNSDLDLKRPVILQEPGHFIVAKGILNSKYSINDPLYSDNTTLASYSNSFQGMRRFSLTNTNLSAILLVIPTPGEILITDSQGRKLGKDPATGVVYTEIPNGNYYQETPISDNSVDNTLLPPAEAGNYYIEILDPENQSFTISAKAQNTDLTLLGYDQNADVTKHVYKINDREEFKLNYSPEPGSQIEVAQIVDIDIKPGNDKNVIELEDDEDDDEEIKVAVLTTPGFDANPVDIATVRFGPGQAQEIHDISKKNFKKLHLKDVDKDGDTDLILHFRLKDVGFKSGDTEVCLVGKTTFGDRINGCDRVRVIIDN